MNLSARSFAVAAAAFLIVGCAATTDKWEYRTRTTDNPKGKAVLDGYGNSGWELVSYTCRPKDATGTNFVYQYVFKRPKNFSSK
jgi:hypothetical protein